MGFTVTKVYQCDNGECNFSSQDKDLVEYHDCDTNIRGYCEDFPACGHEAGDCNGEKYGSDSSIKAQVQREWDTGHGYCEHEFGIYNCEDQGYDEEDE